ncbi:MAG: lycopene cyclase domain-containing protein [Spirochaetales bacterium]|nr:lycopene cyclase domain-containing protein [Spirochaetales bacterium]
MVFMNLYVYVNLAILFFPLVLSFDRKVHFYTHLPRILAAMIPVSTLYIIWDIIVTGIGHWSFNKVFAGGPVLLGLPLGEILFFITVPYSCLFVYEVLRAYFPEKRLNIPRWAGYTLALVMLTMIIPFSGKGYTVLALASAALAVILITHLGLLHSRHFLLFLLISYLPFLIFNGVLTALPVVEYGPAYVTGVRITSIPIEDFFYNFSLLGITGALYALISRYTAGLR